MRLRRPPVGSAPGTLAIPTSTQPLRVHVIEYNGHELHEHEVRDVEALKKFRRQETVCWIDVSGYGDEVFFQKLAESFGIHSLVLADVIHTQRPKTEVYPDHQLINTRMAYVNASGKMVIEQVSIVFGPGFVVTFQEPGEDVFDPIRARLRSGTGPLRERGADFLAYTLVDTIVDGYFPVIEKIGDMLDQLEAETMVKPTRDLLTRLYKTNRTLVNLRRAIWPQRDMLQALMHGESTLISAPVRLYLRDAYDHVVHIIDLVESYRDMSIGLTDIYLSSINNRMSEIMKVLTILSSIFIPLTFLAGVYGMNFHHMPELDKPWGYPAIWGVMVLSALAMLYYFKKKGWLTENGAPDSEGDGS